MDQIDRVIELFGEVAPDARFHDADSLLRLIADLALREGFRALDFGCGNGLFALDLARTYPRSSVVGLDLTPAQIERARANAFESELENVSFELGDLSSPILGSGSFDLVLALQVVQFLEEPFSALERWRASLAPGGWLVLTTSFVPQRDPGRAFATALSRCFIPHTPFWDDRAAWNALLERAGFRELRFEARAWNPRELPPRRAAILAQMLEQASLGIEQVEGWLEFGAVIART